MSENDGTVESMLDIFWLCYESFCTDNKFWLLVGLRLSCYSFSGWDITTGILFIWKLAVYDDYPLERN